MFAECSMSMLTRYKLLNSDLCHGLVFKMPALVQVPTTPTPCQGLYANISILEHSCINNASKHFDGDNRVVIRYCTVLYCTVPYCTVLYCTNMKVSPHTDVPHILWDFHAEGGHKSMDKLDRKVASC